MKTGDPLLINKWFRSGKYVINLDWISFVKFTGINGGNAGVIKATVFMVAAGKRKYKKIKMVEEDAQLLLDILGLKH